MEQNHALMVVLACLTKGTMFVLVVKNGQAPTVKQKLVSRHLLSPNNVNACISCEFL